MVPALLQVERLLPLCECVYVIKRFVETRSRIDHPMVAQVGQQAHCFATARCQAVTSSFQQCSMYPTAFVNCWACKPTSTAMLPFCLGIECCQRPVLPFHIQEQSQSFHLGQVG